MELKQIYRKPLIQIIFCLSMIFGLILTNSFLGTGIAGAAEISWNIGTDGDLVITSGGEYHVTGSTQTNTITVDTADPVIVTLDNVSIDVSLIAGECAFDSGASVTVYLKGANILKSGGMSEDKLGQPGLKNQGNDNLVIAEDPVNHGSLTATGGNRGAGIGGEGGKTGGSVIIYSGTVTAIGGLGAAGIGGGGNVFLNNQYVSAGGYGGLVTVNGGTITATGGSQGAGIGGGVGNESATNVDTGVTRINGGTVNATGGDLGAGIGGGCYSSNGSVFIDAGIVTATGGPGAAGIGGGHVGSGGTVTIRGGNLTANGGGSAAGIGGGVYGSGAVVEIQNGTVIANGGGGAAGIGSGANSITTVNSGTVHIINGTVTATGGSGGGAGIGGGWRNNGAAVTIDGGTVTANGGSHGAGIGGGESSISPGFNVITDGGTLTVNNGVVTAAGGQYSAGIGGGYWGSGAVVVINNGHVEAYGSGWGAGIGGGGYGGQFGVVGTLTIKDGYVQAEGGESAAGIGGGYLQIGGTVNISGGEVIARGGTDAAGIGGGREKAGGTVNITGGSITASGGSYSAGIGGGAYGAGGTVIISNGTVTAVGGTNGAGIGAGFNNAGGTVTITGGSIKASGNNSDDIGGSGSAKGTGVITNGTELLDCRIMEDYVAEEDPEPVTIQLTVTRSTPHDYSYVYNYTGKGHGDGDTNLYFYLPVRIVTELSLESSLNPSIWGDEVTLTAELDSNTATGSVKFFDEDVLLGTATLNDGSATFDIDSLLPGTHTLRAEYLGDEFYAPSTSDDLMQTVNKLQTIITLASSQNPAPIGTEVAFTATVDQVDASGAVEFYDGASLIDTIDLVDGIAVLTISDLILGTHPISATYQGDSYYASGDSNVVEQVITKIPTDITLTSSLNPSSLGAPVTFTATINPLTAVGSIDFYDNGMWVGEIAITDGNAVFVTYYSMTLGSHSITAAYAGNEIYAPGSTGTPLSQQILNSTTGGGGGGGGGTSGEVTSATVKVGNSSTLLPYNAVGSTIYVNITQKILNNLLNMGLKEKGLNFDLCGISQARQLVLPSDNALFEAKYLIVGFPEISLNFDQDTLAALQEKAKGGAITITGKKVDKSELNQDQQKKAGDNQVYEITVLAGGERVSDLGGQITATIPYTLKEGEDADHIAIWCLKENGELEEIHCSYDIVTRTVTFVTDHLSYYVVGYQEASVWANPFSDVGENDWYYDSIAYTNQHGMLNGVTATAFGPNETTTRGMVVTVLWRIAGEPTAGENGFSDVKAGAWYYDAVTWAAQNDIVEGYGDDRFGPNNAITREQMAVILFHYAEMSGYPVTVDGDMSDFADEGKISAWAAAGMTWAVANGLIEGREDGLLDPSGFATRAEVAAILMRFCEIAGE